MVDALDHMTRTCDVCFYISDLYVTSRLGKITEMAGSGWLDTKGKPIANREEWCRLFKAINQLPDPHEITAKTEKHSYSAWLREEMKHRECGRILGQESTNDSYTSEEKREMKKDAVEFRNLQAKLAHFLKGVVSVK